MNSIHPTAQIIGNVSLGSGNTIGALVVIIGPVTMGDGNWIGTGSVIGAPPEVRSWEHPSEAFNPSSGSGIIIGNKNVVREYAQIHQGWHDQTRIGNDGFIMNQCYVAHDCVVEDGATLASSVLLGGHVRIGAGANLGLGTSVHQRRYVGAGAMVGMGSVVTRNVPPFAKAYGNPARVVSVNSVGMVRAGIPTATISAIESAYRVTLEESLTGLDGLDGFTDALAEWRTHAQS